MKFIKIPGINGLGHTSSVKDTASLLFPNIEEIKINYHNIQEQKEQIYNETKKLLDNENLFIIGGDHSISYPIGLAFLEKHNNPGLIIFDAHADCMPPLTEPTHEEWLSALLTRNDIPVIIIGLRKIENQEKEFIEKHNILINPSIKEIKEFCKDKNIYVSFDIDSLDPSIAPATYYLEKDGLTMEQAKNYIKEIPKSQIKIIDLVEIHTNYPKQELQTTLDSAKEIIQAFKQQ
ncbi:hypothetical protein COU62_03125 [Candidatus Pacearchaeota archaeon CG10_big_fil_rev_8_21_14_0_10_35_219]|nr:arginase family protein [Candidatus Pacearchaeota archaeon]OIO42065.1 MAG: hypothetical protein AUJ63_04200 [Candidatus Pacearchaeota archaeon CG1_02_35_32]PIO07614.1 MAG: hypothetical protein COU62_03125 [Candidatus Pacearchaeota archaeon CG10_big_fil_rev_8_21_14_0_10_35_219]PIY81148.1 MAG: hypothetical protein COY79_04265 [Candidatus Pacearchaeota archaeon CG_4_10_14_0_8_um_filter_35_169]PIZ79745.1 MAG: hypothetical protein COY00_03625 [Candidatus Pacearchaeota archaeon CG_4_10_14_0_2_um_f